MMNKQIKDKMGEYEEGTFTVKDGSRKWWQFWKKKKKHIGYYRRIGNLVSVIVRDFPENTYKLDSLPISIEQMDFIGSDGRSYPMWMTDDRVYVSDFNYWPDFAWKDEFEEGTCTPVLAIPTTNISGFYKLRKWKLYDEGK